MKTLDSILAERDEALAELAALRADVARLRERVRGLETVCWKIARGHWTARNSVETIRWMAERGLADDAVVRLWTE